MKNKKLLLIALLVLVIAFGAFASTAFAAEGNDIIIIYENDIHCNVNGYSKLAALKKELADTGAYVGVVSSGDYLQGDIIGNLSKGEYITKLMNAVGYDAAALGNHEFDYRLPRLFELVDMMNTKPICSNFKSLVDNKTIFEPYSIVSYGDTDIAYIGITTPDAITSSSPVQFTDQNGNYIYSFSGDNLFETVQQSIDDAKAKGADYIIALSHLGTENVYEKWSSQQLVKNTTGLDIVLDAHSHSVVESMPVADKSGSEVIITSTGEKFANIGKLTISEVKITTELIPAESYQKTDAELDKLISDLNNKFKDSLNRVVGKSNVFLTTVDKDGNRIIRHQETNLGDFCADAYRIISDSDVAFINGGGIRSNIDVGDITVNDLMSVFPWGNTLCTAKVTGRQIADMLELAVLLYPVENGTFQHVSGISFVLNSSIPTSVKLDENAAFVAVEGERRVSDIKVLDKASGEYKPIDFNKEYILASHNHLLLDLGGGANMFKDAEIILKDNMLDIEVLEKYITEHLNGVIDEQYTKSQNRITVISQAVNPTTGVEFDLAA